MKNTLKAGLFTSGTITVDQPRTIDFMGEDGRVYGTSSMVRDSERACRDFLLQHLDPGEDSVGVRIELDHVAPALLGMPVTITAKIAEVKGRLVTFEVEARDSLDLVGRGRHQRFIVDTAVTAERLKRKAAKLREANR
jgi:fluoroacetyl-CoA thioesterase